MKMTTQKKMKVLEKIMIMKITTQKKIKALKKIILFLILFSVLFLEHF